MNAKDQLKLLDDMIEYYRTHPRGKKEYNPACQYLTEDGARCAVGRLLPKRVCVELEKKTKILNDNSVGSGWFKEGISVTRVTDHLELSKLAITKLKALQEKYNLSYLRDLQALHDDPEFWVRENDLGHFLSTKGKVKVQSIRENILGIYYCDV
jgi:hypothetical protein